MNDDSHLDDLERYLKSANVLEVAQFQVAGVDPGGAHAGKTRLLLEGGLLVLAKPEIGIASGRQVIRREVGAWVFARELGWPDLVACTVLRDDVPLFDGSSGPASVQVVWPEPCDRDCDINRFGDDDTWRAAIFDVVIGHSDRTHNWLGMLDADGNTRVRLVDHGYSFDFPGRSLQSSFYERHKDGMLPSPWLVALRRSVDPHQANLLQDLFSEEPQVLERALQRAGDLLEAGTLTI